MGREMKMIYQNAVLISALLSALSQNASASTPSSKQWLVDLDKGTGNVEFRASGHPSSLKIVGKGSAPHGNFNVAGNHVSGVVTFDLNSLDTGIDLRTHHMKEKYLETGKYQQAKLTIQQMQLPQDLAGERFAADVPFTGKLSLHGVEKPVSGTAHLDKNGDTIAL